jgi:hypothetical protein
MMFSIPSATTAADAVLGGTESSDTMVYETSSSTCAAEQVCDQKLKNQGCFCQPGHQIQPRSADLLTYICPAGQEVYLPHWTLP